MRRITDLDQFPTDLRRGAVTIGNFDGVHRGHARIVERLTEWARRVQGPAIAFTFDPPPAALLRPESQPPPLTWLDRKADLLADLGLDALVVYPTDRELLGLEPREFFEQIVVERLGARALVEGPNFLFGRGRTGDIATLAGLCGERGLGFEVVEPLVDGGEMVSSSRVRQAIQAGEVADAARMLTRPYRVRGTVVRGAARGATIGFPTANLTGIDTLLPTPGVYAGKAWLAGQSWSAAIHLGPIPTFQVEQAVLEVHLLDFQGDLYGRRLEVEWLDRVRGVEKFAGVEQLRAQLQKDIAKTRQIAAEYDGELFVVRLGESIRGREDLFREFVRQLQFPGYFGWNWDAFEECLRDLSWLPVNARVRIIDEGGALNAESKEAWETCRSILQDVAEAWRSRGERTVEWLEKPSTTDF